MNKENLVYLRESVETITVGHTIFKAHKPYRCVHAVDGHLTSNIVYGEPFSDEQFNIFFETAHERIMRNFTKIGLLVDGKVVNKKTFKELAYTVKYGKGEGSFYVAYFYTHPKECMYRFSPLWAGGTKAVQMINLYNDYIDLVNGNVENIDNDLIQFGNRGLPLGRYRDLDTRWIDPNPKSIL